jgi:hypothetical protein
VNIFTEASMAGICFYKTRKIGFSDKMLLFPHFQSFQLAQLNEMLNISQLKITRAKRRIWMSVSGERNDKLLLRT